MNACTYRLSEGGGYNRDLDLAHTCSAPFSQHRCCTHTCSTHMQHAHMQHTHMDLACASQVIEAAGSRQTVQRCTNVLQEAQGDDIEPEEDWATLPLQGALPYLCKESPNFRGVLAEIARSQGRCNASPPCMQLQRCGYNRTSACSVIADHANSPCTQGSSGISFSTPMA